MSSTAGTVMLRASAHLNDINQLVYNSEVLLPMLNMALDELEEELNVFEINDLKKSSVIIPVPAGSIVLPQVPIDLLEVISLQERAQGSGDDWIGITEVPIVNPNLRDTSILQWSDRVDRIEINPPSIPRDVIMNYVASMAIASTDDSSITIESARRFLALLTARNAARDLGNSISKASTFESDISRARDRLVRRLQKKSQSSLGVRRRPFIGRG